VPKKRNKYNNVKREYDGHTWDSLGELGRYVQLQLLVRSKDIRKLEIQVRYDLYADCQHFDTAPGVKVCFYRADFTYERKVCGKWVPIVEDVKGKKSGPAWSMFRLKAKLFAANYGFEIQVVDASPCRKFVPKHLL
jgi:hypothetical protein